MANHHPLSVEKIFFLILSGLVVYLLWIIIQPFALVLLTAAVAAIILAPIERHLRAFVHHQKLSSAIISLGVVVLVLIPLLTILLLMAKQASDLLEGVGNANWLLQLQHAAEPVLSALPSNLREYLMQYDLSRVGPSIAKWSFEHIGEIFSSASKLFLNTFLFFIALYYLLSDRDHFYDELLSLSPLKDSVDKTIVARIIKTVRSVVFGVLILGLIQGTFTALGMGIFGVPAPLVWGAMAALASLVPLVGTSLVLIPGILYLFFTGETTAAIGLSIWSAVIVGLADNFLGPYLIKGTTHMHAFLVLLSVLGGIQIFGTVGTIAGPTILAAGLALIELYKAGILMKTK